MAGPLAYTTQQSMQPALDCQCVLLCCPVAANFPICVIHGRHDMLASHQNAEILAERLGAPCIILDGAHFIVRECAGQINMILTSLILGQQHIQAVPSSPYLDPPANLQHKWEEEVCMSLAAAGAAAAAVHPR